MCVCVEYAYFLAYTLARMPLRMINAKTYTHRNIHVYKAAQEHARANKHLTLTLECDCGQKHHIHSLAYRHIHTHTARVKSKSIYLLRSPGERTWEFQEAAKLRAQRET